MEGNPRVIVYHYTHTCLSSVTQILLTTGVTGPSAQQCHSDHQCHSQAEHESGPPRIFFYRSFPKAGNLFPKRENMRTICPYDE